MNKERQTTEAFRNMQRLAYLIGCIVNPPHKGFSAKKNRQ